MSLDPAVEDAVESGQIARIDLIRFDLPGKTVGYHRGGRPFTYNGLTYLPNRWLQAGEMDGELGPEVTARTIVFSDVPTDDPDDAVAELESYAYTNAPVITSHLCVDPETGDVLGVLASSLYEINDVNYKRSAAGDDGTRTLTITIELEPPGRSARGSTGIKRSAAEQNFDNEATDTAFEYVGVNVNWPMRWSRVPKD
jgi:hypothetical protein